MTPEQFAYWLQGFAEVHGNAPSEEQWAVIKAHLDTIFKKVTKTPAASPAPMVKYEPIGLEDALRRMNEDKARGAKPDNWPPLQPHTTPYSLGGPKVVC